MSNTSSQARANLAKKLKEISVRELPREIRRVQRGNLVRFMSKGKLTEPQINRILEDI